MNDIAQMIAKARQAQRRWEQADQVRIDKAVREIAKTVWDNAEELARLTVDETGMGNYEDNVNQDKRKAEIIWNSLKGKKSTGIIRRDEQAGIVEIAKPAGVVGVALPVTIPVTNFMANSMFSLKARNAVILAPHPRAVRTTQRTAELVQQRLARLEVPENLIQYITEPSFPLVNELMAQVDIVVATGGMGVVKAAYASGRPAYGVGPGNVQCLVDRGMNASEVVEKIVLGRSFNNGLPCACEQAVIVPNDEADRYLQAFAGHHTVYLDEAEKIEALVRVLFDEKGALAREAVGISAAELAGRLGLTVPKNTKVLLVKAPTSEKWDVLRREKLCPVTLFYTYRDFAEAVEIARANLEVQGKGHSVVVHSQDREHIEQVALAMPVTRVCVNQCCTTTAGGSYFNSLIPSTTLGCGFWGNNSINENLTYKHLLNITRIVYPLDDARAPSPEELWGED